MAEIEQPKRGDGEEAWRRYAGALRHALQDANRRATAAWVDAEVARLKDRVNAAEQRADTAVARARAAVEAADAVAERRKADRDRAARSRDRAERALVAVFWALRRGDVPRAFEVIERAARPSVARRMDLEETA